MSNTELERIPQQAEVVSAKDFMPLMTVAEAIERKHQINGYIAGIMKEGDDYGQMPGDSRQNAKKVLLKPGAEKLCSVFGLVPQYIKETVIEDWTGAEHGGEPLFYYEYRCLLYRGGRAMGEAIGSANSWETKYRYRWVTEDHVPAVVGADGLHLLPKKGGRISEPKFAIDKAETSGRYGKPMSHWQAFRDAIANGTATPIAKPKKGGGTMEAWEIDSTLYRIPNPDVADVVNTLQKMAQKRALVAAVLVVTNCSDAFTQDIEDFEQPEVVAPIAPISTPAAMPEELSHLFGPEAPPKAITVAFEMCRRELIEALPQNGEDEYRRILTAHNITAKGPNKLADVRAACIDCWTLAREIIAKRPQQPEIIEDEPLEASFERGER